MLQRDTRKYCLTLGDHWKEASLIKLHKTHIKDGYETVTLVEKHCLPSYKKLEQLQQAE